MMISWTVELAHSRTPPMGAKMTPTAKNSGSTVLGVKMGCHAFSRCCLKALSVHYHQLTCALTLSNVIRRLTRWSPALLLLLGLLLAFARTVIIRLQLHGSRHVVLSLEREHEDAAAAEMKRARKHPNLPQALLRAPYYTATDAMARMSRNR